MTTSYRRGLNCTVASLLAVALVCTGSARASASTLFVDAGAGSDANACVEVPAPCRTIAAAVKKAEAAADAATIVLAAGVYEETIDLTAPAAGGVRIAGAGSGSGGSEILAPAGSGSPTVALGAPGSSAALAHVSVVNPVTDVGDGVQSAGDAKLEDVAVRMRGGVSAVGVREGEVGSLTLRGSSVTMEGAGAGTAVLTRDAPLSVVETTVSVAPGSTAAGISSEAAALSITASTISLAASSEGAGVASSLGTVAMSADTLLQASPAANSPALQFLFPSSLSIDGVSVTMSNPASRSAAVAQVFGNSTIERLQVTGSWLGAAFQSQGAEITMRDSRLIDGPSSTSAALLFLGAGEAPGLLVQRSVIETAPAAPAALAALEANATIDSSELLGGRSAALLEQAAGKARTLTIAGSTLDAGTLGARDGGGAAGVTVAAGAGSVANAVIEGSILLEPATATVLAKGVSASVACTYSDAPDQSQAAGGEAGAIACAAGAAGNTNTEPAALFSAPPSAYLPGPFSLALDSVPPTAIVLPFGMAPSASDLAGNPRVVDGNGDCVAAQDRGALESQGHAARCPAAPGGPSPASRAPRAATRSVLSALRISPSSFFAAARGPSVSAASRRRAARRYGTVLSWRDSEAASVTLTVLRRVAGHRHGRACSGAAPQHRHAARCTVWQRLGALTHSDRAGADALRFSGRLHGRRLAPGAYVVWVRARNAAGASAPLARGFAIR
jgi:hypothetical protein